VEAEEGFTSFLWVLLHERQHVVDWAGGIARRHVYRCLGCCSLFYYEEDAP
jgi:hypothetical protein